jgi:hypothetical protein
LDYARVIDINHAQCQVRLRPLPLPHSPFQKSQVCQPVLLFYFCS